MRIKSTLDTNSLSVFGCSSCLINDTEVTLFAVWHYAVSQIPIHCYLFYYLFTFGITYGHNQEVESGRSIATDTWWSYPQVVFAAERLQQLLVVSVAHLSQEGQQTRHKLSLTGQNATRVRRTRLTVVLSFGTFMWKVVE